MRALMLLALVALVACGRPAAVNGTWTGDTSANHYQVSLTLLESGGIVSGDGTFGKTYGDAGVPVDTEAVSVSGTWMEPELSATWTISQHPSINFVARVDGDKMSGHITGSGFEGEGVNLTRK
jgi:hypothetical protein